MGFLIKEYKIPILGIVKFMEEATGYDKSFKRTYYAQSNSLGKFCINCNSIEELTEKVTKEIRDYFNIQKKDLELEIENEKKKLNNLESHLSELEKENWIDKYQTDNELQLEKQKKVNVKWNS